MRISLWPLQREEKEQVFSFCEKEGFEFSHPPEYAFTSGAIYCLKTEIFWASPHNSLILIQFKILNWKQTSEIILTETFL